MILTNAANLAFCGALNPHFSEAFSALRELAEKPFQKGRHAVSGEQIFINALEYETHPEEGALMEAHHSYIDIMWMVSGEEQIGVCPVEELAAITQPYDETGDALLGQIPAGCTYLQMKPDSVCILFPEDAHAPGLHGAEKASVRKLIAKVRVV